MNAVSAAISPAPGAGAAANPGSAGLPATLQELPQGGKLLPLVQSLLPDLASGHMDAREFLQRLTAGSETLADGDLSATDDALLTDQLALILQPLVQDQPALRAALPPELQAALARQSLPGMNASMPVGHNGVDGGMHRPGANDPSLLASADAPATAREFRLPLDPAAPAPIAALDRAPVSETALDMRVLMSALQRLKPGQPAANTIDAPTLTAATGAQQTSPTHAGAAPASPILSIPVPVGQADWDQMLGERIQWLASQKVQGAQVKLNPANLGPMEVRVQVQNDQATVHFTAHHAAVREALEAALPRLRDMFEAAGVQLVDVDVSGESFARHQQAMQDIPARRAGMGAGPESEGPPEPVSSVTLGTFLARGRLDLFA